MASVYKNAFSNTLGNKNSGDGFNNPSLRKLSGKGYNFADSVIKNSEAIGSVENLIGWQENSNVLRYGTDFDSNILDFVYSDLYSKKNIPFFDQAYPSKVRQLRKYATQDEIEMILDTLTDEICVYNTDNYFANIQWQEDPDLKPEMSSVIKDSLNENFNKIYSLFGFKNENTAWHYIKKWLVDGYISFEIIWDKSKTKIIGFKEIDPVSITPKIFDDGTRGWVQYPDDSVKKRNLSDAQILLISYSAINNVSRVSYLERLIRSFNLLRIMEQTRIIWSVVNSQSKTQFIIPIKGKTKTNAKQTISSLMQSYRENLTFDSDSGELSINGKSMMPFTKEYWMPEGESGSPKIESLSNEGPDLSDTGPLSYWVEKLIRVSKVPKNRFESSESPQYSNSVDNYTREEIYFGRFKNRLRMQLQEILLKPTLLQTQRDIPELADDVMFESRVSIQWCSYDVFEELKEVELLKTRLELVQTAKDSLKDELADGTEESYFSSRFLVEKYLKNSITSEEMELNKKYKEAEKAEKVKMNADINNN